MIIKDEIYEADGKRYQIAGARCVGDWATVAIDEADPNNRRHTIIAIELKRARRLRASHVQRSAAALAE